MQDDSLPVCIEADVKAVQKALDGTAKSLKSIRKQVLGAVGRGTAKAVRQSVSATTSRLSGQLRKAYGYKVKKDGSSVSVWPTDKAVREKNHVVLAKASVLSYGYDSGHRKGPHVAARNFVQAGQDYVNGGGYEKELNKIVEKELKKYWG